MLIQYNFFTKLQCTRVNRWCSFTIACTALFYFYADSTWAQDANQPSLNYQPVVVKIISAEIIRLPKPRKIRGADQTYETDQAMLLKTAVTVREYEHFPPARQPMIYIGERRYPILKQEVDNWDYVKEKPINPEHVVGDNLFLYALIPDWQALTNQQRVFVAVNNPKDRLESPSDPVVLVDAATSNHAVFDKSIIIDRR